MSDSHDCLKIRAGKMPMLYIIDCGYFLGPDRAAFPQLEKIIL